MIITVKGLTYASYDSGGVAEAVVYDSGKQLENLTVNVDINFEYAEGSDYADGIRIAHKKKMTGANVAFELADLPEDVKEYTARYIDLHPGDDISWALLRCGMASVADFFIAQLQDYLCLGRDATVNNPGTLSGNWQWRLLPGEASPELAERIRDLTELYER